MGIFLLASLLLSSSSPPLATAAMPSTILSTLVAGLAVAAAADASVLPRKNSPSKNHGGQSDPAFTISPIELSSVVNCTGGMENLKKPFLLVPGTWANATMAYEPGWREFLASEEGGSFTPCYVAPPPYMTADIQDTLEYIVYAVEKVYNASGSPFPVMGHSQGGLAIQSALTYYPSIRKKVSQYISLAGSLHGTTNVPVVSQASLYNTTMDPAVWQQGAVNNWVTTLRQKGGWYNWVPTTTLFSTADMTVRPQINDTLQGSATYVAGSMAGNILVQKYCPDLPIQHNEFLVANFGYQVVKMAVAASNTKNYITPAEVQQAVSSGMIDCSTYYAPNADIARYNQSIALVGGFASGSPRVIAQVHAEPLLRPFVKSTPDNEVHNA